MTMGYFSKSERDDVDDYGAALAGYQHDPDVVAAQERLDRAEARITPRDRDRVLGRWYQERTGGR